MKIVLRSFTFVVAGFVFAIALTGAFAWTGNNSTPPANNAPAPLNATAAAQYKQGALSLGLTVNPTSGSIFDANGVGIFRGALSVNKATLPTTGSALDVEGVAATKGLLVNGGFQLLDTTPGNDIGKVLVSDANGVASWATVETTISQATTTYASNHNNIIESLNSAGAGITADIPVRIICNPGGVISIMTLDQASPTGGYYYHVGGAHAGFHPTNFSLVSFSPEGGFTCVQKVNNQFGLVTNLTLLKNYPY